MKVTLRMFGYALIFLLALPVACRLAVWVPYSAYAAGCLLFTIGSAWPRRHTPESLAMAETILGALADIGMSQKEAAYRQEITPSQFSAQISGRETFNGSRLPRIGTPFMVAWIKRLAAQYELMATEQSGIGLLVQELQSLIASRKEVA